MCVACVLHVCCMCVACVLHVRCIGRPIQITPVKWGSRKQRGRRKSCRWQGETLEAERLGYYIVVVARSIHLCGVVAYYTE